MKLKSIGELTDKVIGKKDTKGRNKFEYELKMDILGDLIKENRISKKITISELSKMTRFSEDKIIEMEESTKNFTFDELLKIFEKLGAKFQFAIEFEKSKPNFSLAVNDLNN